MSTGRAYGLLAALTLLNVLNFADRYLVVSFSHSIITDLKLSNFEFALLSGLVFAVFYSLFGLFAGSLSDRFHRPRLIALGLGLWSALTAATGLARSFGQVALARVFIGVGEAMLTPAAMSMLADTLPPHRRSLGAALYYLGIPVGIGASFIFAAVMGPVFGWRGTFVALGGVGVVASLLVLWLRDPPRGGDAAAMSPEAARIGSFRESFHGLWQALKTTPVLRLTLLGSAATIFVQGASVLDIVWWVRERGYTETDAQRITGIIFLTAGIVGSIIGGVCADALHRRGPGGRLMFLVAAYLFVMPIGLTYRLMEPATPLFYACAFVASMSFMIPYGVTFPTVQEAVPVKLRGAAVALLILCNTLLGQACGAAVAGFFADFYTARGVADPITAALLTSALPALIAIPLFYRASRLLSRTGPP